MGGRVPTTRGPEASTMSSDDDTREIEVSDVKH
jgi:hypothetical protein